MTSMHAVIIALATIVGVTFQPAGRMVRLGDIATTLLDDDVAEIVRLASCGPTAPWLMTAFSGQMANIQVVEVYCAADQVNGPLRRGQLSWSSRENSSSGLWSRWALQQRQKYAQLVPDDRSFEEITGEQDHNRPFRLYGGDFTDEELISLVKFLRSGPQWTAGNAREQVETKWPVTLVGREADGTIVVKLSKDVWQGQRVTLRRSADGWTIVRVNYWVV